MFTLPATNAFRDGQSVLLLDDAQAAPILARLRNAPEEARRRSRRSRRRRVRVNVQNGSGVAGAAGKARDDLGAAGFALGAPAANADRSDYDVTEVRYGPGDQDQGPTRARVPRRRGQARLARLRAERRRRGRRARPATSAQVDGAGDVHVGRAADRRRTRHDGHHDHDRPPGQSGRRRFRTPAASTPPNICPSCPIAARVVRE